MEAAGCTLLSCNVAWHAQAASQNSSATADSSPFTNVQDAIQDTLSALDALQSPATPAAPAFQVDFSMQFAPATIPKTACLEACHIVTSGQTECSCTITREPDIIHICQSKACLGGIYLGHGVMLWLLLLVAGDEGVGAASA